MSLKTTKIHYYQITIQGIAGRRVCIMDRSGDNNMFR